MQRKTCTRCGDPKILTDFYKQKNGQLGRTSECKACKIIQDRKYTRKKRERARYEATRPLNEHENNLIEKFIKNKESKC